MAYFCASKLFCLSVFIILSRIRFVKEVREVYGMDRHTDGQIDTSSPLLAHFRSTSGHFQSISGSIGGHMRHHSYSLPKKMNFPKFVHKQTHTHTHIHTEKKVTPKDPLRLNA